MARYRNIQVLIWNDDKFPFCSDDCQLVFFHLMTTPFSNPFGLYKIPISALAEEKRWPNERYTKAFKEGFSKGFVKHDPKALLIYIPNFLKYNPPNNPNVLKSWSKLYDELPSSDLKNEFYHRLKALCEGLGEGFAKGFAKGFAEGARKGMANQEQEQEQEIKENIIKEKPLETANEKPENKKRKKKAFVAPSENEVNEYGIGMKCVINPKLFFDYYSNSDPEWHDRNGKPVVNWKQKFITWNNKELEKGTTKPFNNGNHERSKGQNNKDLSLPDGQYYDYKSHPKNPSLIIEGTPLDWDDIDPLTSVIPVMTVTNSIGMRTYMANPNFKKEEEDEKTTYVDTF